MDARRITPCRPPDVHQPPGDSPPFLCRTARTRRRIGGDRLGATRRASAAILIAAAVATADGTLLAGVSEGWERWERLQGIGWGDGYHACAPSGHRPFADLPPRDPLPPPADAWPFPRGLRWQPHVIASPGLTCYDLFDAGHDPFVDDDRFVGEQPFVGDQPFVGGQTATDAAVPPPRATMRPAAERSSSDPPPRTSRRITQPRASRPRASDYRLPAVPKPRLQELRLPPVEPHGSR